MLNSYFIETTYISGECYKFENIYPHLFYGEFSFKSTGTLGS